jgi:hypothetical protein
MLLWILLAVIVLAIIGAVWFTVWDGGNLGTTFMAAFIGTLFIAFIYALPASFIPPSSTPEISSTTHELRSLGTGSSVGGRFYLGGGNISGTRVINYVQVHADKTGEWTSVESVDADGARIYEDEDRTPHVIVRTVDDTNYLLVPFFMSSHEEYEFHVPAGSVAGDYSVDSE